MADPIPRNSRADETAEFRRAEQERRGNRPLFGEGVGGGLRARLENAQQQQQAQVRGNANPNPFARAAQAQPQPRPNPAPPQPPPRPNPPQAAPRTWIEALRHAVRHVPQIAFRRDAGGLFERLSLRQRFTYLLVLGVPSTVIIMLAFASRLPASPAAAAPDGFVVAAPMIPAPIPAEICAPQLTDVEIDPDEVMSDTRRALVASVRVAAKGCAGQMVRLAVWIYQAENQPLAAPGADPVYRSPLNQLTVQTLVMADGADIEIARLLALPHVQFPTAVGSPVWLTVGVQVWPEGRPAQSGAMVVRQVYFSRAE